MANVSSGKHDERWHQDRENKCHEIEGKQFVSLEKFPRFRSSTLAPNTLAFKDGKFYYGYGCAVESGSITCEIDDIFISISGITDTHNNRFTGNYNRKTKRLIWENIEYIESNNSY
jgi:hypothetical protein